MSSSIKIFGKAKFFGKTLFGVMYQQIQWILSGGIWKDNENWRDEENWQD
jgi:hypothetical protein